jgi:hypothetical protein
METQKDPGLWRIAKKRASFQKHLIAYLIVNGFLWALWWMGKGDQGDVWPIWPSLGWGIGLAFNYFDAYHGDKGALAEREYEKLEREKKNRQ